MKKFRGSRCPVCVPCTGMPYHGEAKVELGIQHPSGRWCANEASPDGITRATGDALLRKGPDQEGTPLHVPMWDHSVTKLGKIHCRLSLSLLVWVIISITIFDLCAWQLCLCCCSDVGVECVFYLIFENSHGICEILSDNKLGYCYSLWTGNRAIEAGMNKIQESSPLQDADEALDVARWKRCSMCPIPQDPERPLTSWSQQHRISCILWAWELLNRFPVAGRLAPLPGIHGAPAPSHGWNWSLLRFLEQPVMWTWSSQRAL